MPTRGRRPVRPRFSGWGPAPGFGGPFALIGGMRQAGDAGTALLVGGAFGAAAVGLYNRAQTVTDMLDKAIIQALSPVVLPLLTRELRRGGVLGPLYLRKLGYLSVIRWPFFSVLLLLAEPAVRFVLGTQWGAAVPLVQALAVAGLFGPYTAISMKFFVALGANGPYARLQLAALMVKLGAVAALSLVSLPAALLARPQPDRASLRKAQGGAAPSRRRPRHRRPPGRGRRGTRRLPARRMRPLPRTLRLRTVRATPL